MANSATEASRSRVDVNLQWNRFYGDSGSLFSIGLAGFALSDDYQTAGTLRNDYSADALTPQLGINHWLGEQFGGTLSLISNASVQKRPPSFFELFGSQGFFEGNPALVTEESKNFDIGVGWQSAASDKVDTSLQLVWFYQRKDNLIARVYDARGVGRSENISAANGRGIEFSSRIAWQNGLHLDANLTLQDTTNASIDRGSSGKQLPGEAAVDGVVALGWKNPKWKVGYSYRLNADRYDSPNNLAAADQKIHSVNLSRYFKQWRIDVELNNLTDHVYEDFNGYPKPGRSGFISVFINRRPRYAHENSPN